MNKLKATGKGFLTALKDSIDLVDLVVYQFDDLPTGDLTKLVKGDTQVTAKALAELLQATADNNKVGLLSLWAATLWEKVGMTKPELWKNLTLDEKVRQLNAISKVDAQVNAAIDWAKKQPSMKMDWVKTEKCRLLSQGYSKRGTLNSKTGRYFGELEEFLDMQDVGEYSPMHYIHEALADVPETRGMKVVGSTESGFDVWAPETQEDVDTTAMKASLFNVEGELPKQYVLLDIKKTFSKLVGKFGVKADQKLQTLMAKCQKKWGLTTPTINLDQVLGMVHELNDILADNEVPYESIRVIIGELVRDKDMDRETAWKLAANHELNKLMSNVNAIHVGDDTRLADKLMVITGSMKLWARSWAEANRENGGKPVEDDVQEDIDSLMQVELPEGYNDEDV